MEYIIIPVAGLIIYSCRKYWKRKPKKMSRAEGVKEQVRVFENPEPKDQFEQYRK